MEKRLAKIMRRMVEEKHIPQYVYKMKPVNRYLFDTLINSEIWFAKPKDFNDPFDCDINLNNFNTDLNKIQSYFNDHLRKMVAPDSLKQIKNPNNITVNEFDILINTAAKKVLHGKGISCFLDNPDNLLMWAHYADSHKGICLKFDVLKDLDFFSPSKKVIYQDQYPDYSYLENKNEIINLLFFKSSEWEYEGEVRVIKEKPASYRFHKQCLIEVIFGCNISDGDKKTLTTLFKTNYPHTTLLQAKKKNTSFALDYVPI